MTLLADLFGICSRLYQALKPSPVLKHFHQICILLREGDVIVLRSPYIERLVPGYWSHAGIYVGDTHEGKRRVLQARGYGVRTLPLRDFLRSEYALIVRPRCSSAERQRSVSRALSYCDKPFDFEFDFKDQSCVCCSELVYAVYKRSLGLRLHPLRHSIISRRVFLPDDVLAHGFSKVWVSPEAPASVAGLR